MSMLVADLAWVNPRRVSRWLRHAEAITEVVTPTGHVAPARLPVVREAVLGGGLDEDQVDAIVRTITKISTWASGDTVGVVERHLVDIARAAPASTVAKHGERGAVSPGRGGVAAPVGDRRTRTAEELAAMLGALAKPDGAEDDRTSSRRLGDAFCDVVHRAIDAPDQPVRGGEKPHVNVTMDYTYLAQSVGHATLEGGAPLPAAVVRRIACDAGIIPLIMNGSSVPMDVGRTRRLVTAKQRAALIARDQGCALPNCDRPPRWADAHHIKHWLDGGGTNLNNMVLLCRRHHRMVHHSEWEVVMSGVGVPEFVPPRWIDPAQVPRRNLPHPAKGELTTGQEPQNATLCLTHPIYGAVALAAPHHPAPKSTGERRCVDRPSPMHRHPARDRPRRTTSRQPSSRKPHPRTMVPHSAAAGLHAKSRSAH